MALAESNRLRSPRSFAQVYKRGRKANGHCLVARALKPVAKGSTAKKPVAKALVSHSPGTASIDPASADAASIIAEPPSSDQASAKYSRSERVPERGDWALSSTRFGISISRKVSKRAVVRNRIKRQIRAVLIGLMPQVRSGFWVVITVRSAAISCEYDDFLRELRNVLTTLEVLHGD